MPGPALEIGVYGKLPAVGDFVRRGLSAEVTAGLQDWLQRELAELGGSDAGARDQAMIDSPSWRFVLSSGVLAEPAMAGVFTPSCDRVGRIYPCIALVQLSDHNAQAAAACSTWFEALDRIVARGVGQGAGVDEVFEALQALGPPAALEQVDINAHSMPNGIFVESNDDAFLPGLAVKALTEVFPMAPRTSLWWRRGGGGTRMLLLHGLPVDAAFRTLFVADPPSHAEPPEAAGQRSDVSELGPADFATPEFDASEFTLPDLDIDAIRA